MIIEEIKNKLLKDTNKIWKLIEYPLSNLRQDYRKHCHEIITDLILMHYSNHLNYKKIIIYMKKTLIGMPLPPVIIDEQNQIKDGMNRIYAYYIMGKEKILALVPNGSGETDIDKASQELIRKNYKEFTNKNPRCFCCNNLLVNELQRYVCPSCDIFISKQYFINLDI